MQRSQRFLSPIIQNEGDGFAKLCQALFTRFPLAIGARHLGTVSDMPWPIPLDNRREFMVHGSIPE